MENAKLENVAAHRLLPRGRRAAKLSFVDETFDGAQVSNFEPSRVRSQPDKLALFAGNAARARARCGVLRHSGDTYFDKRVYGGDTQRVREQQLRPGV
ncbi:MAG: hypothetical protein ACLVB5_06465 [Christensenellales bacterium]